MKIFAFIVLFFNVLLFIILPSIDEYKKHKGGTKKELLKRTLMPALFYIGLVLVGFLLFEVIPIVCGQVIENIFL